MLKSVRTNDARKDHNIDGLLQEFSDEWAINYIKNHFNRCADDVERFSQYTCNDKKILNIGGAPYIFEFIAFQKRIRVDTIDLDPNRHRNAVNRIGINAIKADIEDKTARDSIGLHKYDVICLCEVLEHMRVDLIGLLEDLYINMHNNTLLYVTTPNSHYAPNFRRIFKRSGPSPVHEWSKLKQLGRMGHFREYSKIEVIELLTHVGFSIERIDTRTSRPMKYMTNGVKYAFIKPIIALAANNTRTFGQEFVVFARKRSKKRHETLDQACTVVATYFFDPNPPTGPGRVTSRVPRKADGWDAFVRFSPL